MRHHIRWFFFLFLISFVFALSIFPIISFDTWWHLKTGEYIWQNKTIPHTDIFSYTIYGKQWITFEWLSQLVLYAVYAEAELSGLTIFKALVVCLIFILMIAVVYENSNDLITWPVFAFAFLSMRDGLRERPQIFTYLFCILYLFILRKNFRFGILLIPLVQIIWVNMHGASALIGFGIVLIYTLFSGNFSIKQKIYLPATAFLAMFINPNTYNIFVYVYVFFRDGFNHLIMEYFPPKPIPFFMPYFSMLVLIFISLLLPVRRKLSDMLVISLSMISSLMALRNIPVFIILSTPLACERISIFVDKRLLPFIKGKSQNPSVSCGEISQNPTNKTTTIRECIRNKFLIYKNIFVIIITAAAGVMLFAFFWILAPKLDVQKIFRPGFGFKDPGMYAAEFISWCSDRGLNGPIFNEYNFGGYFIWRLYPKQKVFVDGRLLEYGIDFIKDAFSIENPKVWNKLEGKYKFTVAVLNKSNKQAEKNLQNLRNWPIVYKDKYSVIFFKDVPENRWFIEKFNKNYK